MHRFIRPREGTGETALEGPLKSPFPVKGLGHEGPNCTSPEITITSLHLDIVLWVLTAKPALLIELTIPWEEGMSVAYEHKKAKYAELAAECKGAGWSTTIYPWEVGCRGYISTSTIRLLHDVGFSRVQHHRTTKALAEEAEKASFWLWLRRRDKEWGLQGVVGRRSCDRSGGVPGLKRAKHQRWSPAKDPAAVS